jgi:hypothetical protein
VVVVIVVPALVLVVLVLLLLLLLVPMLVDVAPELELMPIVVLVPEV